MRLSEQLTWDTRQVTAAGIEEGVRLAFAFEYQSKLGVGWASVQMTTETNYTAIGVDTIGVSGAVVAADEASARMIYQTAVRASYAAAMVTEERTRTSSAQFQMPVELGGTADLALAMAATIQYQIASNGAPVDLTGLSVTFQWNGSSRVGVERGGGPGGGDVDGGRHGCGRELPVGLHGGSGKLRAAELRGDRDAHTGDHGEPMAAARILVLRAAADPDGTGGGALFGYGQQ